MSGPSPTPAKPAGEPPFGVPPATPRGGRVAAVYWAIALLAYAALGAWKPYIFLLGFWQTAPFLLLVTWLAPKVWRRLAGPAR